MAVSDILGSPRDDIVDKLKADGWKFQVKPLSIVSRMSAQNNYIEVSTPEGEVVTGSGDSPQSKRYKQAKIKAAEEIFGMKYK